MKKKRLFKSNMFKGPVICKFKSITETVINFTNLFDFKLIN